MLTLIHEQEMVALRRLKCILLNSERNADLIMFNTEMFSAMSLAGMITIAPKTNILCSGEGAINILLQELGVWREVNKDEFDSLNLGIYRRMDKWLK